MRAVYCLITIVLQCIRILSDLIIARIIVDERAVGVIAKVDIENKILHDMVNALERFDYETTKKLMERMP